MSMAKKVQSEKEAVQTDASSPKIGIFLKFGYQDKEDLEQFHKHVSFGRRPTAKDFMRAAEECGGSDIQFALALMQSAIVGFGQMTMPVPLTVLLSLNQIDREILNDAYYSFLVDTGNNTGEILEGGKARLAFGIERAGKKIVDVEFGKLLSGYEEIEIEREAVGIWQANALRMAKEIVLPTDLALAEIESLDVDDFATLRNAEEKWLDSFRKSGEDVA